MIYFVLLSDCCIFANSMNIPEDFELYTRRLIGDDEYKSLADALATESPVSIRLNRPFATFGCVLCSGGIVDVPDASC